MEGGFGFHGVWSDILAGVAAGFAALEDFGDLERAGAMERDNAS